MAIIPGSATNLTAAGPLAGEEVLVVSQVQGAPVAATALVVGLAYKIVSLGTTDWAIVGAGVTPSTGLAFVCEAVGTGTGTAEPVESRSATAQDMANLVPPAELPQPLGTADSPTFANINVPGFVLDGGTFN